MIQIRLKLAAGVHIFQKYSMFVGIIIYGAKYRNFWLLFRIFYWVNSNQENDIAGWKTWKIPDVKKYIEKPIRAT